MAITKAAKKALRSSEKRRVHNLRKRRVLRDLLKEIKGYVALGKTEQAKTLLPKAQKALDKAVKTGLLKKNTGRRRKSLLARAIHPTKGSSESDEK